MMSAQHGGRRGEDEEDVAVVMMTPPPTRRRQRRRSGESDSSRDESVLDEMLAELGIPRSTESDRNRRKRGPRGHVRGDSEAPSSTDVIELLTPPQRLPDAAIRSLDTSAPFALDEAVTLDLITPPPSPPLNPNPVALTTEEDGTQRRKRQSLVDLVSPEEQAQRTFVPHARAVDGATLEPSHARELRFRLSQGIHSGDDERKTDHDDDGNGNDNAEEEDAEEMKEEEEEYRPLRERLAWATTSSLTVDVDTMQSGRSAAVMLYDDRSASASSLVRKNGNQHPLVLPIHTEEEEEEAEEEASMPGRRHEETAVSVGHATPLSFSIPRKSPSKKRPRQRPHDITETATTTTITTTPTPTTVPSSSSSGATLSRRQASSHTPMVAAVALSQVLHDSSVGEAMRHALATNEYNNKRVAYTLEPAFASSLPVIQWERRRGGASASTSASPSISAASLARHGASEEDGFALALHCPADRWLDLLDEEGGYDTVLELARSLQAMPLHMGAPTTGTRASPPARTLRWPTIVVLVEAMDKALVKRKKRLTHDNHNAKTKTTAETRTIRPRSTLTFSDLHELSFQLYMDTGVHTQFTCDTEATVAYVVRLTRELLLAGSRQTELEEFLDSGPRFHSFRVMPRSGSTMNELANAWLRMLQVIPGVSEARAQAIVTHFPTFQSLQAAYADPSLSQEEKEDLLADKLQDGRMANALSRRVFRVVAGLDPDAMA